MALKVVTHPISDNLLMTNNKETFILGAQKVIVGVNSGQQEIATNPDTGLNYLRDRIDGQTVYDLSTQKHHPWFILDFETGDRGWYPGKPEESSEDSEDSQG